MQDETTLSELRDLSMDLMRKMDRMEQKIDTMDAKIERRFDDLTEVVHDFASDTERRLSYVERKMVTKDHLDRVLNPGFVAGRS